MSKVSPYRGGFTPSPLIRLTPTKLASMHRAVAASSCTFLAMSYKPPRACDLASVQNVPLVSYQIRQCCLTQELFLVL